MGQCVSAPAVSGETEQQMRARWEAAPDGLGACAPRDTAGGASPQPKPKMYTTTANVGLQRPPRQPVHHPAASTRLTLDPIDENNSLRANGAATAAAGTAAPGGASPVRHHPHAVPASSPGPAAGAPGPSGDAHPRSSAAPASYTKGQAIGQGAFGTVYLGMDNDTGRLLAIKEVPLAAGAGPQGAARLAELVRSVEEEVALLQDLDHPNVVAYLGTERSPQAINILMEYVPGGSIANLLAKFGSFNESVVAVYTKQILAGLTYLHAHGVIHRDIKGANILVDNTGLVKLADFGASKKLVSLATIDVQCQSIKGTPYWMAPEVIMAGSKAERPNGLDVEGYGSQADIWSVACTVIEMATGKPPWSQYSQISAMMAIVQSKGPPTIPEHLSPECKDFLYLCFNRNWRRRPSAAKLLQHPFLADVPLAQPPAAAVPMAPAVVAPGMSPLGNHISKSRDGAVAGARRALDMDAAAVVKGPLLPVHSAGLVRGTGSPSKQPAVMASAPVFSPGMFARTSSGGGVAPLPPLPVERPEVVEPTMIVPDPATLGELRLSGSGSFLAATLRVDGPAPTEPAEPSVPSTVALSGGLAPTVISPDFETQLVDATVVLSASESASASASLTSTVQQQPQPTVALSGSVGASYQSQTSRRGRGSVSTGASAGAATSGASGSSRRSEFNPMEEPAWMAGAGARPGSAATSRPASEGEATSVEPLQASGRGHSQHRSAASSASSGGCRTAATASEGPVVYTVEADGAEGGLPWDLPAGGSALTRGGSGSLASGWTRGPSAANSSGSNGADQAAIIGALREQAQQDVRASMAVFQATAAARQTASGSSRGSWGASAAAPPVGVKPITDDATEVTSPARHRVSLQPSRIPRAPDSPAKVQLEALRRSQAAAAAAATAETPSKSRAPLLYSSTPSKTLTRAGSGSGTILALVPPSPAAPTPSKLRALQAAAAAAGGVSPTKRVSQSASLAAGSYEQQLKARQQLQFGSASGGVSGGYAARAAAAAAGTPAMSAVNPLRTPRRERPATGPGRATPGRRASAAL